MQTPDADELATVVNPFDSDAALRHSHYLVPVDGVLTDPAGQKQKPDLHAASVDGAFRAWVLNPQFSCVGAKSAVHHDAYRLGVYAAMGSPDAAAGLARDLFRFLTEVNTGVISGDFATFVAVFREPLGVDESAFERAMWTHLRLLHRLDAKEFEWDPSVSSDPRDPHFSFSFARRALFVVSLHPHSSRIARQFPWPAMVFNPHDQFERLREKGQWERMKQVIREKELALQGGINPTLTDFGELSEARQYSGRSVEPDWLPPFRPRTSSSPRGDDTNADKSTDDPADAASRPGVPPRGPSSTASSHDKTSPDAAGPLRCPFHSARRRDARSS